MNTLMIIWLACAMVVLGHRVYDNVKSGRKLCEVGTLLGTLTAPVTLLLAAIYGTADWLGSDASLHFKQELHSMYIALTKEV